MKRIAMIAALVTGIALGLPEEGSAQGSNNVILRSNVNDKPTESFNDCWGYASPGGDEYAIIGYTTGTLFYRVTDPANPVLVGDIPGSASTWRDMKTNGTYCYIVTEGAEGGVQIVDLSDPDNPTLVNTYLPNQLKSAHNIFIDTVTARAYVVGTTNSGGNAKGVRIVDVGTDPVNLTTIGNYGWINGYVHDIYVEDDIAYAGHVYDARLGIIDVSDPANPTQIASASYGHASHATWLHESNHDYLFTADEEAGGLVRVWDISNLASLTEVATYQSGGIETSVHNVFVKNDTLYAAYYKEGFRVVDVTNPLAPVEIGYYDTYPITDGGFTSGCWGAYPYLPSGTLIASDITYGLFLFEYVDGAGLVEGVVTDTSGSFVVPGTVAIPLGGYNDSTDESGNYSIGSPPGLVSIVADAWGFLSDTSSTTILASSTVIHDISLTPAPGASISGTITAGTSKVGIENAAIDLVGFPRDDLSGATGGYAIEYVPTGSYTVIVSAFGFDPDTAIVNVSPGVPVTLDFTLTPWFFADNMDGGNGWVSGDINDSASTGLWTLVDPNGTGGGAVQPEDDHSVDPAVLAWITGQSSVGGSIGENDVDGGQTTLYSDVYDVTTLSFPEIIYHRWFTNNASANPGVEPWVVQISNDAGASWVTAESTHVSEANWKEVRLLVHEYVTPTNLIQLRFIARDLIGAVVEAGVDDFGIRDNLAYVGVDGAPDAGPSTTPVTRPTLEQNRPNPFNPTTSIRFVLPARSEVELSIYDPAGRLVKTLVDGMVDEGIHSVTWSGRDSNNRNAASGVYLYRLNATGKTETKKLILVR